MSASPVSTRTGRSSAARPAATSSREIGSQQAAKYPGSCRASSARTCPAIEPARPSGENQRQLTGVHRCSAARGVPPGPGGRHPEGNAMSRRVNIVLVHGAWADGSSWSGGHRAPAGRRFHRHRAAVPGVLAGGRRRAGPSGPGPSGRSHDRRGPLLRRPDHHRAGHGCADVVSDRSGQPLTGRLARSSVHSGRDGLTCPPGRPGPGRHPSARRRPGRRGGAAGLRSGRRLR